MQNTLSSAPIKVDTTPSSLVQITSLSFISYVSFSVWTISLLEDTVYSYDLSSLKLYVRDKSPRACLKITNFWSFYPYQDWSETYKSHICECQLIITGGNAVETLQLEKVFLYQMTLFIQPPVTLTLKFGSFFWKGWLVLRHFHRYSRSASGCHTHGLQAHCFLLY